MDRPRVLVEKIREDDGVHFDPELRDAFLACLPRILAMRERIDVHGQAGMPGLVAVVNVQP
jgi:hypothetical protein